MTKKIPLSTYVFGAIGLTALIRALWNPHRMLATEASIAACAGQEGSLCEQTLELRTPAGADIYATGGGQVIAAGPDWLHVLVANEPVVLFFDGMATTLKPGDSVWRGQVVGTSPGRVRFGVWTINPNGTLSALEPAAWLAARGYQIAGTLDPASEALWCGKGRQLSIPKSAHATCKLGLPAPATFSLLPVSLSQE